MRTYLHLFLNLLMPIALIVSVASVIYFSINYDFSKALNLGLISGVLIALPLSLIGSLVLLLTRKNQTEHYDHQNAVANTQAFTSTDRTPTEQKLMVLMDKDLAFEVALFSITDQNLGEAVIKETKDKNTITLRTYDETIQIMTTALTRHTAQVLIKGVKHSQELQKIISYIKEKEYSFLQY